MSSLYIKRRGDDEGCRLICNKEKQMKATSYGSEQRPMKMYYMISLFIHAVLVMMVLIAGASGIQKPPETVTVVLNNEAFMAGGSGGDGKIPGSQAMGKIEKRISREDTKVKRHHRAVTAGKIEEVSHKTVLKEDEKDNAIPSNESSELTLLGNPMKADADFDMEESGIGFGGGGTGIGGYGSGSGFGGIGKGGMGGDGKGYGVGRSEEYMRMKYLKEHFNYIRDLIMRNLTYPLLARKMGWKGGVTVSFVITEKGTVERIRIIKSSGHKILDENVERTIREVQPFPRPPVRAEIIIPVIYKLG
jgi:protein TonB